MEPSHQSFADIANVPTERLEKLPGFGQVKVKRVRDAFDKPFKGAGTAVPLPGAQPQSTLIHPHPPTDPQDTEPDTTI